MNDSSSTRLYLGESPATVPIPKVVARAYLWLVGAGTVLGALVFAVASQSSLDAVRITASDGTYAATLVSAMAVTQSRRLP